jgi:hypothetical protein
MDCRVDCRLILKTKNATILFLDNCVLKSDLDWIQTSNLLSRNQVRYSVAPQGHLFC